MDSSQAQNSPPRGVGETLGAFFQGVAATPAKVIKVLPSSEPSPMDFAIATPAQEPGMSAATLPGMLQALQEKLEAVNGIIAMLQAELGEVRAKIEAEKEKVELAVKIATLEAKKWAQAMNGALLVELQQLLDYVA